MNTIFKKLYKKYKFYKNIYKSRKELLTLSDEMLSDIGKSRAEAELEAAKYFWQTERQPFKKNIQKQNKQRRIAEAT